eukprot:11196227-Lingulodinium_polyedra.AAC.1
MLGKTALTPRLVRRAERRQITRDAPQPRARPGLARRPDDAATPRHGRPGRQRGRVGQVPTRIDGD